MKKAAFTFILFLSFLPLFAKQTPSESVYRERPDDPYAIYFDGKSGTDVTALLQQNINDLKVRDNFGIIFIPEGKYYLSSTIYIPPAIRLIGYGKNRPEFILKDNCPAFQTPPPGDKGEAVYLFWFTGSVVRDPSRVSDAGAGTFYSAFSNIDITIGKGNPSAVALRTHYAQHSFISFCDINIGEGKAGVFDVGNEMTDVRFFGGDWGIYTTKTSPSWQFTLLDSSFEGQRKAAIRSREGGWIIRRVSFKNAPVAFEIEEGRHDKVFLEDCIFDDIKKSGFVVSLPEVSANQVNILNSFFRKVPVAMSFRDGRAPVEAPSTVYHVDALTLGLCQDDMVSMPEFRLQKSITPIKALPALPTSDIPRIPDMGKWVNILSLGAVGDNSTDNTEVFRKAIEKYDIIYIPQGEYRVSETITLGPNTTLIGLNPISTQITLSESSPSFSGLGSPVPMMETPVGGHNFVSGIGINAGGYNYRAVGIKWQGAEDSYLNDVKFLGIHGTMKKPVRTAETGNVRNVRIPEGISTPDNPVSYAGKDKAWDNQHWSLWVNKGGGTFKDLWSADTYATSGILITDTSVPGRMYEISVEHHVRNEVTLKRVSGWSFYGLQLEEELRESPDVQQIEIQDCKDILFANLYLFRVIWIETPLPQAIRLWGDNSGIEFFGVHNFTQMRMTTDLLAYDVNKDIHSPVWELSRLSITGNEPASAARNASVNGIHTIATGLEAAEGLAADSKGNVYFCEQRGRRIYMIDHSTGLVRLVSDLPWQVLSLGCDTEDNLLVCIKYYPQPGNPSEPPARKLSDKEGTTFSWWGNEGFEPRILTMDPLNAEETVEQLERVLSKDITRMQKVFYPSHRWRDLADFVEVNTYIPEYTYVAKDGKTFIPEYYDLLRSSSLSSSTPGGEALLVDEYNHLTYSAKLSGTGWIESLTLFDNRGAFSADRASNGTVCVSDGFLYFYDRSGKLTNTVTLPLHPTNVLFLGNKLYVTARSTVYRIDL